MNTAKDAPVLEGEPLSEDNARLMTLFDEIEAGQLAFLDEAAKRVIELVTLLFGATLTFVALGNDFPPSYLKQQLLNQWLTVIALGGYLIALVIAAFAAAPRTYKRYPHNLTMMRKELDKIIARKKRGVQVAGICFVLATAVLGVLIGKLVLTGG